MKNLLVLITGASSGIGEACARVFASHHYDIVLCGRRKERLELISNEIKKQFPTIRTHVLSFDVRDSKATADAIRTLSDEWHTPDILINNAGLALGTSPIQDGNMDDWHQMIDTNIKGILHVSNQIIPNMIKAGRGHIINIGSIAGKETYLNGNVYCASKAAVDSLTKAMRIDLLKHRIKVTHIAPGATETEFSLVRYKGDTESAAKVYQGFKPLMGEDIAQVVYFTASLPAHVNINDLVVVPTAQANTGNLYRE